jgi:hypothetical protein
MADGAFKALIGASATREQEERNMGLMLALWIIAAPALAFVILSRR